MNNSEKQQSVSNREVDEKQQQSVSDREVDEKQQQSNDDSSPESTTGEEESTANSVDSLAMRDVNDTGLAARLTDFVVGDGDVDSDLLMQRNTQQGTGMQWLLALDMQVMGACRADERLKPLLKVNASSVVEGRLQSHLSQHFEPLEVGMLARCLCNPLASIRVGKIKKQGTLLTPTSIRIVRGKSMPATPEHSMPWINYYCIASEFLVYDFRIQFDRRSLLPSNSTAVLHFQVDSDFICQGFCGRRPFPISEIAK
ncbi:hypothetical protein E3N88_38540 [Mikania micrantha]|uniref:Uncharacterized protein n=1 Tax=Mikania micrantha TaxID=192012 RepID=A0A5N6LUA6_9ASTR|nr:hypothetical protein E3N88_38540 [Mikania micrantha]